MESMEFFATLPVVLLIEGIFIAIFFGRDDEGLSSFIGICTMVLYLIVVTIVYPTINGMIQISNGTYELYLATNSLNKEIEVRYNYKNESHPMDPDFDYEKKQILLKEMYECKYGDELNLEDVEDLNTLKSFLNESDKYVATCKEQNKQGEING
jgi:hypothetical protein